jgi:SAM-dependent methyltransferase
MNYAEIIRRCEESKYLISMTPVEKIVEVGYNLDLCEQTRVLDLCCGYGEMLKIWSEAFGILGKGVDCCKKYIETGKKRLEEAKLDNKILLTIDDVTKYIDNRKYDVVCLIGVGDLFGGIESNIKMAEKYLKPNGKIVIGEAFANLEEIPNELTDFEGQLLTLHDIYHMVRKLGYFIINMAGGTDNEWERYITSGSKENILNLKKNDKASIEWEDTWFDMYFNYRRIYEGWALFTLQ